VRDRTPSPAPGRVHPSNFDWGRSGGTNIGP
jgi:hypothetical protein